MVSRLLLGGLVAASALLAGCNAGGPSTSTTSSSGSSGGTTTTTSPGTITEVLSSSTVTSGAPVTVSATVRTGAGVAVPGTVVTFSTGALGALSSATALTNSSGVASVTLSPTTATAIGADTVVASATVGSTSVTASQSYQLTATTAAFSSFSSDTGTSTNDKLLAYGQAVLTVGLTGVSTSAPATVTLTSQCVAAGKATISPSSVSTTSTTLAFSYKDIGGCGSTLGADTVTATISGSGTSSTDQVYLTAPTPNNVTFSSATPSVIYLSGSGGTQSSIVKFRVVDTDNNPLPGQVVSFALTTSAGGLHINSTSQTSDADGYVTVTVNSGTVPTPVRVLATLNATGASTVSSQLAVATGLPTQLRFSLSQGTINIEGGTRDNTPNVYTVYAADRSGNPVPDGTAILFWAEGGQIQATASTSTTNGISSATAQFISQDPRPADGRVTILAYAIGEESFIDLNATNVYASNDPYQPLGDIVKDELFDNIFDPAHDETIPVSQAGATSGTSTCAADTATYPQFALDQTTPNLANSCAPSWSGHTYVRKAAETIFSTSYANPLWASTSGLTSSCSATPLHIYATSLDPTAHPFYSIANNADWYTGATSGGFSIIPADENVVRLNPMAAGTTLAISASDSAQLTIGLTSGTPVANSSEAQAANIAYKFLNGVTSAQATLTVTSPSGAATAVTFTLHSGSAPSTCGS